MKLTPAQIKQLRMSQGLRVTPPTVGFYFRANWRAYTYLCVLCTGAIVFFVWGGWPIVSGFFAGFLFAAVVRDLKLFAKFVEAWPLSNEITDWRRVEELLAVADETRPNKSLERTREE
jgi:hypothetical protein